MRLLFFLFYNHLLIEIMELIERIKKEFPIKDIYFLKIEIYKNYKITVTIAKEDGRITLGDCELVTKRLKTFISDDFDLIIQSPGIGWEIDKEKEIKYFINEKVNISYKDEKNNKIINKKFILKGEKENFLILEDLKKKENFELEKENIIKIKVDL